MRTIAALSFAAICAAQTFSFEAASVKPSNPAAREQYGGGPGTENPRQITYIATLQRILTLAYGVRDYQVSGPSWITTDKFEIIAKVPAQASPQQVGPMLQSLLAERFALQVHRDSREFSGYELQVARSGLKMKESAGNLKIAGPQQDGKPAGVLVFADWLGHRAIARLNNGLMRYMGLGQSAADLATLCENQMHLPVVDRTGLKGVLCSADALVGDLVHGSGRCDARVRAPRATLHYANGAHPHSAGPGSEQNRGRRSGG
ncbi:MAG TPA: TIGR03435 family protein, partial [Verrucomicrobiae bacterium]|nr:TIGR03435 family protein [Verrucomicrobiae bacterium]